MGKVIIGIDLGGTNLRIGAVDADNNIVAPKVVSSAMIAEAEEPIRALCEVIETYIDENGLSEVEAVSIGVPSSVGRDKETVICTTNIRNKNGDARFCKQ